MNIGRLLTQAVMVLAMLGCHLPVATAQDVATEQSVRAAMVFNFLKFADFPGDGVGKPVLQLCVAARDARQAEALAALSGRRVGGRKLNVVEFTARSNDCQIFYVDSRQRWNAVAEQPALRQALTISEYPGFARDGGMIEIDVQNDGARFDINLAETKRAGLHFSPQMLRLARQIHE
ncbi:MAG: YfiR family protein [Pseudomonadota bacterium]|nr:YfiR family protein [Pseudomonadota bacterium]MDP1903422.1 YfiR family protein [Pseudomonadota bacterium]